MCIGFAVEICHSTINSFARIFGSRIVRPFIKTNLGKVTRCIPGLRFRILVEGLPKP